MRRQRIDYYHHYPTVQVPRRRTYGPGWLILDIILLFLTNGWWILWILFRIARKITRG